MRRSPSGRVRLLCWRVAAPREAQPTPLRSPAIQAIKARARTGARPLTNKCPQAMRRFQAVWGPRPRLLRRGKEAATHLEALARGRPRRPSPGEGKRAWRWAARGAPAAFGVATKEHAAPAGALPGALPRAAQPLSNRGARARPDQCLACGPRAAGAGAELKFAAQYHIPGAARQIWTAAVDAEGAKTRSGRYSGARRGARASGAQRSSKAAWRERGWAGPGAHCLEAAQLRCGRIPRRLLDRTQVVLAGPCTHVPGIRRRGVAQQGGFT